MRSRIPEHAGVVIGDFVNETGDAVFDGSLHRAVIIDLTQSPYLSVVPDQKLGAALQSLGRSPDDALVPALARQVCQRLQATALIMGSIRAAGQNYSVSVDTERCRDGVSLAQQAFSVDGKQQVLPRLSSAIQDLRRRLGESAQIPGEVRRFHRASHHEFHGSFKGLSIGIRLARSLQEH